MSRTLLPVKLTARYGTYRRSRAHVPSSRARSRSNVWHGFRFTPGSPRRVYLLFQQRQVVEVHIRRRGDVRQRGDQRQVVNFNALCHYKRTCCAFECFVNTPSISIMSRSPIWLISAVQGWAGIFRTSCGRAVWVGWPPSVLLNSGAHILIIGMHDLQLTRQHQS